MDIRKRIEQSEDNNMSEFAAFYKESHLITGIRDKIEAPDEIRTNFMVDRDRILHSNAFKRLKGKTQVFILPEDDHFENRLSHTLECAQIARTIATALNLNVTLAEAIMLGHDIGHTPFGHAGEEAIAEFIPNFKHADQSVRRLSILEKRNGIKGLNLTAAVLDGIKNHSGFTNDPKSLTKEGTIALFADKIAYLTSDMSNALHARIITEIPPFVVKELGSTKGKIISTMVKDIISASIDSPKIQMSPHMFDVVTDFRDYMFKNVYYSSVHRVEVQKAKRIIGLLFEFFSENPDLIPSEDYSDPNTTLNISDYISSMTDRYCLTIFKKYFLIEEHD